MFFVFPLRDEYRVKKFPYLVLLILIINVYIFFTTFFNPEYESLVFKYGFIPSSFSLITLFTSMFLHGGFMHLGFNMWYLWLLGDNIEDRWGSIPFLFFYLSAGVFSMLLYSALITEKTANIPTIGASGAISGILGAYAVLFPKNRITFKYFVWLFLFIIRFGEFRIYAIVWLMFWFIEQGVSTFLAAKEITVSSVAFGAHFAGFLYGAIIGLGTKVYREVKYRENIREGETSLFNLLGEKKSFVRSVEEDWEIEKAKNNLISNFKEDKYVATLHYANIIEKYPEVTLPEKLQYQVSESLYRQGVKEKAYTAYKNFVSTYTFSKYVDNALLNMGKLLLEKEDYEKAKYAFLQIVIFYPYSDIYEEAKYYLEKKMPQLIFKKNS